MCVLFTVFFSLRLRAGFFFFLKRGERKKKLFSWSLAYVRGKEGLDIQQELHTLTVIQVCALRKRYFDACIHTHIYTSCIALNG